MKQNKRFILLVVMVLLANCLFAGLASAADASGLYLAPVTGNKLSVMDESAYTTSISIGHLNGSAILEAEQPNNRVTMNFNKFSALDGQLLSDKGIMINYTTETGNVEGFVVSVADTTVAKITKAEGGVIYDNGAIAVMTGVPTKDAIAITPLKIGSTKVTVTVVENAADLKNGKYAGTGKAKTFTLNIVKKTVTSMDLVLNGAKNEVTVGSSISIGALKGAVLQAVPVAVDGASNAVSWKVDNTSAAYLYTVSTYGSSDGAELNGGVKEATINFTAPGVVRITAYMTNNEKVSRSYVIEVKNKTYTTVASAKFSVSSLTLNNVNAGKEIDLTKYLTKTKKDTKADDYYPVEETWTSSDEDVIKVSTKGVVTAAGAGKNGEATITLNGVNVQDGSTYTASILIKLENQTSALRAVKLNKKATTLYYLNKDEKSTEALEATITATSDATIESDIYTVTWKTSNSGVVILDDATSITGYVYKGTKYLVPVGVGTAKVTVTVADGKNSFTAECEVTVSGKEIAGSGITDKNGKKSSTQYITASGAPTLTLKASTAVTWTSEDEKVATVADGVVTIVGLGKTHIIGKAADGSVAMYGLNVKATPVKKITAKNITVKVGETKAIGATVNKDAYKPTLKYVITSNAAKKFFSVDAEGNVTGIKAGKGYVKIKADGTVKKIKVTVK